MTYYYAERGDVFKYASAWCDGVHVARVVAVDHEFALLVIGLGRGDARRTTQLDSSMWNDCTEEGELLRAMVVAGLAPPWRVDFLSGVSHRPTEASS